MQFTYLATVLLKIAQNCGNFQFRNAKYKIFGVDFFQLCDLSETVIRHITEKYNLAEIATILKTTQILSLERFLFCCNIIYYLLT